MAGPWDVVDEAPLQPSIPAPAAGGWDVVEEAPVAGSPVTQAIAPPRPIPLDPANTPSFGSDVRTGLNQTSQALNAQSATAANISIDQLNARISYLEQGQPNHPAEFKMPEQARQQMLTRLMRERDAKTQQFSGSVTALGQDAAAAKNIPVNTGLQDVGKAKTVGEAFSAIGENPWEVTRGLVGQSLPAAIPIIVSTIAAGPLGGLLAGATTGAITGGGNSALKVLNDNQVDTSNPEAVKAALADPAISAQVRRAFAIGAGVDTGVGGVTGAFGGMGFNVGSTPARTIMANAGIQAGGQGVPAIAGEGGKQLSLDGELTAGPLVMQALGQAVFAPVEGARASWAVAKTRVSQKLGRPATDAEVINDPQAQNDFRAAGVTDEQLIAALEAAGITSTDDPRFAVLQDRLAKRRIEESLRPAPDNYGADGRPVTSDDWRNTPRGVFSAEVQRRQDERANLGQANQETTTQNGVTAQTARATEEGTINPQAANVVPREPDTRPIAVQPDGGAYRADDATMQGRNREQVTREARTLRLPAPGREVLTDAEIALQRAKIEGGNQPTVETPPRLYGQGDGGEIPGVTRGTNANGDYFDVSTPGVGNYRTSSSGTGVYGRTTYDSGKVVHSVMNEKGDMVSGNDINRNKNNTDPESRPYTPRTPEEGRLVAELLAKANSLKVSDAEAKAAKEQAGRIVRGEEAPKPAEPPPYRAPQTSTDMVGQRQAGDAFTLAERQRGRAGADVRDTQVAGRPEGANPQQVYLDDGFPVEIVSRTMMPDAKGNMVEVATVRRYDPRTGKPEADAVEYQIPVRQLKSKSYAAEPRMAQDFEARAETGKINAGRDRGKRMDDAQDLPRQTYRQTAPDPDPNAPGRYTRPEQPDGPTPFKKWSNYEEAMRDFADRQSRGQTEPPKSGPDYSKAKSSNQAGPKDRDGRFVVDENGHVMSSAQGPIRFADQKQAAKWILNVGQKQSPDQIFEIAVHPTGKGFTARERGRSETPPPGGKAGPETAAKPETNRPAQPETPRGLKGPQGRSVRQLKADEARMKQEQAKRTALLGDDAALRAYATDKGISTDEMRALLRTNFDNAAPELERLSQYLASDEGVARGAIEVQRASNIKFEPLAVEPPPGGKAGPQPEAPQPKPQPQDNGPPRGLEGPRTQAPEGMDDGSRIIGKNAAGQDIWEAPNGHRVLVQADGRRQETMHGGGFVPDILRTTDEVASGARPKTPESKDAAADDAARARLRQRVADIEAKKSAPTPEQSFDDKVRAERERLWDEEMKGYKRDGKTKKDGTASQAVGNNRMVESAARENVMRQEVGPEVIREAEVTGAASKDDITDIAQLYRRKEGQSPQEAWEDAYGKWVDKNESEAMRDANLFTQEDRDFDTLKVDSGSDAAKMADVYTQDAQNTAREAKISSDSLDNIPFDEVPNGKREAGGPPDAAGRKDAPEQGAERGGTRQEAGGGREGARDYATDAGPDGGRQTVVPGAERDTRGATQRRADAPLRGGDEAPPKGGLFDEGARNQGDIFDGEKKSAAVNEPNLSKGKPAPNPNYRIRVVEKVDRSIGMRNVKGNVRERKRTVYTVERKDGDTFYDVGFEFKDRAGAQKYIDKRTEAAGNQGSGTTFYSNPFLDPAAWKGLAKSLGVHADYFNDLKSRLESIKESWASSGGKKTNALADLGRAAFYSTDGELRAIGAVYKSPTIKKIADMLFAPADMGKGGAVSRSYHEAVEQRTISNLNKMADVLSAFRNDKAVLNQIRQLVQNPGNIRRGNPVHDAAAKLTDLLDSEFKYLKDAGVDVGKLIGYFPRIVDAEKVLRNPSDFVEAATKQYMKDGIAANRQEAAKLAQAWLASVELGHAGARKDGTDFVMLGGTPNSDFRKERVFGRSIETDKNNPLAKYYLQDPIDVLTLHFQRTARRAEWARRFGDDLQGWKDLKEQIVKEGNVASLKQVVDAIAVSTGTQRAYQSDAARAAIGTLRTWGAIRLLPRATITSLSEVAMPAIRSGDLTRVLGDVVRTAYALAGGMKAERALAADLGLISNAIGDSILGRRYFAMEPGSKVQQDIMNAYFRRTGLEQFTAATRVMSVAAGQTFIRRLAADVDGAGGRQKSSRAFLRELGVEDADGFAKWLMATNDGKPGLADLKKDTGREAEYRTALQRYNQQSSLNPNASTRPKWSNHPLGSLVFMLQSYAYAFQKQVLNRAATGVMEGVTGKGYSMADRATMLAPAMLLPVLAAIQYGLAGPRDAVFGDPSSKPKTPEQEYMQAISRSGLTGILDPYINMRTGARYDRDAATAVAGPVLGGLFQTIDAAVKFDVKNSDKTNTAERNLTKAMYDATLMPAAAVLGGFLPAPIGAAVIQGASSGAARNAFTSAVAGPKPVERPKPPQPPRPPRPPRP